MLFMSMADYLDFCVQVPAGVPVPVNVPVGIQNLGNTCFGSSIIQSLFYSDPVRHGVLSHHKTPGKECSSSSVLL